MMQQEERAAPAASPSPASDEPTSELTNEEATQDSEIPAVAKSE